MKKIALIIIYNHQYNKNINIIERIYKDRFSNIYHLVPFYYGEKANVIPVYECSYFFQGYIAQGLKSYFKEEYTHYFFIADDLMLNPTINEDNYSEHLKLNPNSCFIPEFITLHDQDAWRTGEAFRWNINFKGVEAKNQLPNYEKALQKFQQFNLTIKPIRFNQIWDKPSSPSSFRDWVRTFISGQIFYHSFSTLRGIKSKLTKKKYFLSYPIVGSYSDICVVSSDAIKEFCHYCGVFAATRLFVEMALPTALVLSAKKIVTEKELELQGKVLCSQQDRKELVDKYSNSLQKLIVDFPTNYLYLHPVKLSQWNTEL